VDDVTNILLIGADYVGNNGLSDIMVVASINNTEKTVTCTSLMRDTYAHIPINQGVDNKLNAAHQLGGADLLIATVELNFGIKIDNYIKVDFERAVQVFDLLGGLDLRIDEAEVNFIRKWESSSTLTYDASKADADGFITVHLDGGELRAHARNRSTGGRGDFNRTRRQRDILYAAFEKCKTMSVPKLAALLENILPLVTTDISYAEFMSHVLNAPSYKSYQFETFRIPCDGYWKYWKYYVVVTDLEKTMEKWRDIVYN
jgi:LCP family protein required for cell wall assembly